MKKTCDEGTSCRRYLGRNVILIAFYSLVCVLETGCFKRRSADQEGVPAGKEKGGDRKYNTFFTLCCDLNSLLIKCYQTILEYY